MRRVVGAQPRLVCRRGLRPALDGAEPICNVGAKRRDGEPGKMIGAKFKAPQGSLQERDGAGGVSGIEMVECCCHLDHRLQKALLRLVEREPDGFPVLVRREELASVVAGESFGKCSGIPVERHAFSLCDSGGRGACY